MEIVTCQLKPGIKAWCSTRVGGTISTKRNADVGLKQAVYVKLR